MLTDSARHFISRLTTANLAEMLFTLSWTIKETICSLPQEFFCPKDILAIWFEDEVNNLSLDQKLELLNEISNQIKTNKE